jgi:glycosyltransferase involved in cell wall biosynthesis
MRIAHLVLSNVYAGIEQHVNELISHQESECKVILICNTEIEHKFDCSQIVSIKNFTRSSPLGLLKIFLLIKKMDFDIIHTHGSKTTSIINVIRKFINIKHVATAHGIKKKTAPFLKADKLIAVSKKIQASINRKSIVINNWWSPILPKDIERTNDYVLAVGRLEKVKGFDLLIESWKNASSKLLIIGSGQQKDSLNQLISDCNLNEKITIIDEVSQKKLIEYYKKSSMLIISSRNEGGPRVALEALYLKIPVVSTDVGHMSEILPRELLAKPDNLSSLTDLVERYVGDASYKQDSIFKYVAEEFSLPAKAKQTLAIYKELLVS